MIKILHNVIERNRSWSPTDLISKRCHHLWPWTFTNFSEPQCPHFYDGDNYIPYPGLPWGFNKKYVKYIAHVRPHNRLSVNGKWSVNSTIAIQAVQQSFPALFPLTHFKLCLPAAPGVKCSWVICFGNDMWKWSVREPQEPAWLSKPSFSSCLGGSNISRDGSSLSLGARVKRWGTDLWLAQWWNSMSKT